MRDAGIHELVTMGLEPMPRVERRSVNLSVQADRGEALLAGQRQKILQQRAARALTPPFFEYGQAPDTAIR
jgi:hypothetical protein